ncbi:hypothetical protein MTO99_01460 [Agromyces larvae]|uniref:Uncharacterized protein n=1 Tax=Agromyces larvae TaxID=2929802 RepID=A0ABY4C3C8_9MICO|nr:hypothetical protein [Agromyces larvae]UOE44488.1 hypothetical protein MTO99_01460 [Agromyces larvae]
MFYADADERFVGDIRGTLRSPRFADVQGVRIELFDAYMTADDHEPYVSGRPLLDFREYFGVERRRILMAWRPSAGVDYRLPDSREPQGIHGRIEVDFRCQHYGKALSIEQWDETCRYYIDNFPPVYQERWRARLGKAIHARSDFDTELRRWDDVLQHAEDI